MYEKLRAIKISDGNFFNDPIFQQVAQPPPPSVKPVQQEVAKIGNSQATEDLGTDVPTVRGWDGFWADPVFKDVAGRNELPEGQSRKFWKYEVDESVSVASLFPSLSSSAFGAVSFTHSAIEYWSMPIGSSPAGLYFRTEVEFGGALDGIFTFFRAFIGEDAKPTLRLSAYLGLQQTPDQSYIIDGLELKGALHELKIAFPPVLDTITILSVGVRLTVGTRSSGSVRASNQIDWAVCGTVQFSLPGSITPLILDCEAGIKNDTHVHMEMTIPGGTWNNALGAQSLNVRLNSCISTNLLTLHSS